MTTAIAVIEANNPLTNEIRQAADKSTASRLSLFMQWQQQNDQQWYSPNLAHWRDHLLSSGKSPATVSSYLSTVRGAYTRVLKSNDTRDILYSFTSPDDPPERRQALITELLVRLENAISPHSATVKQVTIQDKADSEFIRLTPSQAKQLIESPDISSIFGLRDCAVIALLLCTGLREQELCDLTVEDINQMFEGKPALRVQSGKGKKQRLIPYGDLSFCLIVVNKWLEKSGISSGYVFRGLYKSGNIIRAEKLTPRTIQRVLAKYPIVIDGKQRVIKPHDARRTYGRLLFDSGMELLAISKNLGHSSINTSTGYIGDLSVEKRQPKALFSISLSKFAD